MIRFAFVALSSLLLSHQISLAQDHRQLGAHEHGHGTLNIAVDGKSVAMELEVPGADIVGFEHVAATPEQKAAAEKAAGLLAAPLSLFKLPPAAGCTVASAKVEARAEEHEDHDHGHDDHAAKDDHHEKGEPTASGAAGHDDAHDGHSEYHATYSLTCAAPERLKSIEFAYFGTFANAQKLTVGLVTGKAQSSFEVARDKPVLDLGGVM